MTLSAAPERNGSPIAAREQKLNITFADTYPVDPPRREASGPEQPDRVFMVIAPDSVRKGLKPRIPIKLPDWAFGRKILRNR